jgi:acyl-CoA synthetase (NDP forming)
LGAALVLPETARVLIRAVVEPRLSAAREPFWLSAPEVGAVLEAAGVSQPAQRVVGIDQAAAAAREIGGRVVVKAVVPGLLHKTEVGGVALGLESEAEVTGAVAAMHERLRAAGQELERVLVQAEASPGIDALVGVVADPTFGPLVVCGLGGVQAELMRDVAFRLTPVSDVDAAEMVDSLRLGTLLQGYRGAPPSDRTALLDVVQRVSALTEVLPEILEMDLNPVRVLPEGHGVSALDARIRLAPTHRVS